VGYRGSAPRYRVMEDETHCSLGFGAKPQWGTEAAPHVRGSGKVKPTVVEGGAKPQWVTEEAPHVRGSWRMKPTVA